MRILIAPDSFKGSLSAIEVSDAIHEGIKEIFPNSSIKKIPFSDGGEGAIDLLKNFNLGEVENIFTEDALGKKINASIFWLKKNQIAWIEMSQISGLSGLTMEEKNPMKTSTYGVGVLINHALNKGCKKLYLGLGGSCTHDMGTGIFVALGGDLLDKNSSTISRGGSGLLECERISFANLNPKIKSCKIVLAVDVDNPLLGKNGAAKTYSSQKGATPKMIEELELGSKKFAELIQSSTRKKNINVKGGGSAGGASAGLYGLINAKIQNGFDILEKLIGFESYIKNSDLIISGEGHLDNQSKNGKLINKIGFLSKKNKKHLICIAGKVSLKETDYKYLGITKAWASTPLNCPLEKAMENAYSLIKKKAKIAIDHYMRQEE